MVESLFPVPPSGRATPPGVFVIEPSREAGGWVFDDPLAGLVKEPFVGAVNDFIDRLAAGVPGAERGFRLLFSARPFDGAQATFHWVRADPVEGHWYRRGDGGDEGWLCPALFCYFPSPPPEIHARAELNRTDRERHQALPGTE
jgi:hypothetical protein